MENKFVAIIIIILLIVVAVAYAIGTQNSNSEPQNITNNTSTSNNTISTHIHNQTTHKNNTSKNETPKVNITAQQAQKIAIDASADLGFPAKAHGTPTLFKWTKNNLHTWVWDVPLEFETGSTKYGSMDVDAYTGKIIMNE